MPNEEDFFGSVIKLAVMACACDGEIRPDENSLLQEWIDGKSADCRPKLQETMINAFKQLDTESGIPIKQVCDDLANNAPVATKYDAIELCLRIAQLDGVGSDEDMRFLMSVGRWLDLDYDRFREMRDKILPISIHVTSDTDTLLGIHAEMTPQEIRKHLLKEYQRWNQLMTHKDRTKREQAKEMLEIIAEKRSEV